MIKVSGLTKTYKLMLMSLGFSAIVGIIFGIVPAIGASRKNPIDDLRYE